MKVCILASDANVEKVRETARKFLPDPLLEYPVSPTGILPATHWFCLMNVSPEMCIKLQDARNLSEIEVTDDFRYFLSMRNLKLVKRR